MTPVGVMIELVERLGASPGSCDPDRLPRVDAMAKRGGLGPEGAKNHQKSPAGFRNAVSGL